MLFRRFSIAVQDLRTVSERMVRYHEQWLTRALRSRRQPPRIPVRRVDEGGFAFLLSRGDGLAAAEEWWERTLDEVAQ